MLCLVTCSVVSNMICVVSLQLCKGSQGERVSIIPTPSQYKPRSWKISGDGKYSVIGYNEGVLQVRDNQLTLTHSLNHSLALTHSLSLTHSLTRSLTRSLTHSLDHSLTHSLDHSLTHSLDHSLTHSLTHSITHSLTCPIFFYSW